MIGPLGILLVLLATTPILIAYHLGLSVGQERGYKAGWNERQKWLEAQCPACQRLYEHITRERPKDVFLGPYKPGGES